MDGDNHRMKQHGRVMASSGIGHAAAPRLSGSRGEQHVQNMHPPGDHLSASGPERVQMSYADYVYPRTAFHAGGSLPPNETQPEYRHHQDFSRAQRPPPHSSQPPPMVQQQQRHWPQAQEVQPFTPYESAMIYGFSQQAHHPAAQGAYAVVPQYPDARQSTALEAALSNQFAVPRYFAAPEEPSSATGVPVLSPYLNSQLHSSYSQPAGPMARNATANTTTTADSQNFPATMADFAATATASTACLEMQSAEQDPQHQQQQQKTQSEARNLDLAYSEYQNALRGTFDNTRAGRLVEASGSLLEISEWLVTNAGDIGILRDDHIHHSTHLNLWSDFNLAWLALCQKQKDILTHDLVLSTTAAAAAAGSGGHRLPPHATLLTRDRLQTMGKQLIQLCDRLEQFGLVDYQMGIWEEEILCVLSQCLDLIENRPDLLHIHTAPEPATAAAAPRP